MNLCPLRMKELLWIAFLLKSTSIMWLQGDVITGVDHHLQCVNDYLFTLNCSLNIEPSENTSTSNTSYWLTITDTFNDQEHLCLLTNTTEGHFCSIRQPEAPDPSDMFTDLNMYEVSLCQSQDGGSTVCEVLDEEYEPVSHIKPNAPCCLTVSHNSTQNHFIWKSTYEEFSSSSGLKKSLQYQLDLYKTQDKHGIVTHINTESTSYSVDEDRFVPDTEYAARVRSSPNMVHYKGQWSDWSSEVLWTTGSVMKGFPANALTLELCVGLAAFFVMVVIISLLCYGPIKVWRQSTFIPTPAPYFHSLYKDYQGDFKSWVVTQETPDVLKEETLQIDTMIKFVAIQDDEYSPMLEQQVMEGRGYSNIPASDSDADLSILYTDSSEGWLSAQGSSGKPPPAWSDSGSPAGDSGCWLCSDTSLEKEPPWYCNEYCTLSCFQQSGCVTAGHHGNSAHHRLSA